ncbi:phospholipid-binding protein [Bradyrhizobium canariense]|uniref:phospholipid-binding protein n=1 Tax=Bradyrhizobium canariense TaxID=255045 RepID=UPI00117859D6|nr:phospholipid-binding protein [Bradyrhizobium canariense]
MRVRLMVYSTVFLAVSTANASAFSMSFRWCGLGSPVFALSGVPKGTATLQFHMIELQVPSYNHGGGMVTYKGQSAVACGALNNYSPPSPPSGSHSYQITVTAFGPNKSNLGSASFTREFPEKK